MSEAQEKETVSEGAAPQVPPSSTEEEKESVKKEKLAHVPEETNAEGKEPPESSDPPEKSDNPPKTDAKEAIDNSPPPEVKEQNEQPKLPHVEMSLSNETNEESLPPHTTSASDITPATTIEGNRERLNSAPTDTRPANTSGIPRPKPLDHATSRTESAPVITSAAPPTASDAGSIGSIPSALDSLAGTPFLSAAGEPVKVVSATPSQLASAAVARSGDHPHDATKPNEAVVPMPTGPIDPQSAAIVDTQAATQQPPLLVAVPQQPQQTLYYQVPQMTSVVAVPNTPNSAHPTIQQQQQQHAEAQHPQHVEVQQPVAISQTHVPIQSGDQVVGMVGAIPILKIPGSGLHYVKKKKGRFNLLQEAPSGQGPTPPGPVVSFEEQPQQTQCGATTAASTQGANSAPIPNNITVPSRSQSPLSGVSHVSMAPQTFDGKSAPTVKKKGRFLVTNVKNPGTMKAKAPAAAPSSESGQAQQQQQQQHQQSQQEPQQIAQSVQQQQHQSTVVSEQAYQQVPMQPVMIQPLTTMQAAYENTPQHQPYMQAAYTQPVYQDANGQLTQMPPVQPPLDGQQHYVQTNGTVHQLAGAPAQLVYTPQTYHVAPQQQQQGPTGQEYAQASAGVPQNQNVPLDTVSLPAHVPGPPGTAQSLNSATPPPTPGGAPAPQQVASRSDLSPNRAAQLAPLPAANPALPNAPVPRPPSGAAAAAKTGAPKKKPLIQGRAGKVPQTFDRDGTWSSMGLGKVFYFLDQMKMEVTEADRCIKNLQADMRLLRDKNKELEAKNREFDRRLREEKALREKVEARNAELRKKLKEAKGEPPRPADKQLTDEKDAPRQRVEGDTSADRTKQGGVAQKETISVAVTPSNTPTKPPQSSASKAAMPSPSVHSIASDVTRKAGSLSNTQPPQAQTKQTQIDGTQRQRTPEAQNSTPTQQSSSAAAKGPPPKGATPTQGTTVPTNSPNVSAKNMAAKEQANKDKKPNDQSPSGKQTVNGNESGAGSNAKSKEGSPAKTTEPPRQATRRKSDTNVTPTMAPLPSSHPPQNGAKAGTHRATRSLHDFDPLSSHNHHHVTSNSDTMLPVISLPASYSFGALPINSGHPEIGGTFMSPNPFVVPVAFEMAAPAPAPGHEPQPPPSSVPNGHTVMANSFQGFQQQQFMVVPQQQHIMFQHVGNGMQQVPEHHSPQWGQQQHHHQPYPGNYSQAHHAPAGGQQSQQNLQQQQQQASHPHHQQQQQSQQQASQKRQQQQHQAQPFQQQANPPQLQQQVPQQPQQQVAQANQQQQQQVPQQSQSQASQLQQQAQHSQQQASQAQQQQQTQQSQQQQATQAKQQNASNPFDPLSNHSLS